MFLWAHLRISSYIVHMSKALLAFTYSTADEVLWFKLCSSSSFQILCLSSFQVIPSFLLLFFLNSISLCVPLWSTNIFDPYTFSIAFSFIKMKFHRTSNPSLNWPRKVHWQQESVCPPVDVRNCTLRGFRWHAYLYLYHYDQIYIRVDQVKIRSFIFVQQAKKELSWAVKLRHQAAIWLWPRHDDCLFSLHVSLGWWDSIPYIFRRI